MKAEAPDEALPLVSKATLPLRADDGDKGSSGAKGSGDGDFSSAKVGDKVGDKRKYKSLGTPPTVYHRSTLRKRRAAWLSEAPLQAPPAGESDRHHLRPQRRRQLQPRP